MLEYIPAVWKAVIIAFVLSFLRVSRDGEPRFVIKITESLICGCIAYSVFYFFRAIGIESHEDFAVAFASMIGMLGSDCIRGLAKKYASRHIK